MLKTTTMNGHKPGPFFWSNRFKAYSHNHFDPAAISNYCFPTVALEIKSRFKPCPHKWGPNTSLPLISSTVCEHKSSSLPSVSLHNRAFKETKAATRMWGISRKNGSVSAALKITNSPCRLHIFSTGFHSNIQRYVRGCRRLVSMTVTC